MRIDIHREAATLGAKVVFEPMAWHESYSLDSVGLTGGAVIVGTKRTDDPRFWRLNPVTKSQTDLIALHGLGQINDGFDSRRFRYGAGYTRELEAKAWVYGIDAKGAKNLTARDWLLVQLALGSYV